MPAPSPDVPFLPCCLGKILPTSAAGNFHAAGGPCVINSQFGVTWQNGSYNGGSGGLTAVVGCSPFGLTLDWTVSKGACQGSGSGVMLGCPDDVAAPGGLSAACCSGISGVAATCDVNFLMPAVWGLPPEFPPPPPCNDPCTCPKPDGPACAGSCPSGPPTGGGRGGKGGKGDQGQQPATAPPSSGKPVRYASGEITIAASDIMSGGFGVPWGHTRSFASRQSVNETLGQGFCWKVQEWSYLIAQFRGDVVIQGGPNSSLWFTPQPDGSFTPRLGIKQTLRFDTVNNVYRLYDLDGSVTVYDGFTGSFLSQTDPAGNSVKVTALSGNGVYPATVQRTYTDPKGNTTNERFSYSYDSTTGDWLLTTVALQRQVNGGAWQNVSQASYTYYPDGDSNGAYEDLKTVTTQIFSNGAWNPTGTTYYRYWKQLPVTSSSSSPSSSSSSSGSSGSSGTAGLLSVHLLKYVLNPAMYDAMIAAGFDPTTASDAQLSLFADYYFEYDQSRRCTKEIVSAGSQPYSFAYFQSSNPQGYNSWATKTIETLPDGNQNIVYCNYAGQPMLNVFQSVAGLARVRASSLPPLGRGGRGGRYRSCSRLKTSAHHPPSSILHPRRHCSHPASPNNGSATPNTTPTPTSSSTPAPPPSTATTTRSPTSSTGKETRPSTSTSSPA